MIPFKIFYNVHDVFTNLPNSPMIPERFVNILLTINIINSLVSTVSMNVIRISRCDFTQTVHQMEIDDFL